jgi:hypothetical protein
MDQLLTLLITTLRLLCMHEIKSIRLRLRGPCVVRICAIVPSLENQSFSYINLVNRTLSRASSFTCSCA